MTDYYGLTMEEVKKQKEIYGYNEISTNKKKKIIKQLRYIISEPMYLLLSCECYLFPSWRTDRRCGYDCVRNICYWY